MLVNRFVIRPAWPRLKEVWCYVWILSRRYPELSALYLLHLQEGQIIKNVSYTALKKGYKVSPQLINHSDFLMEPGVDNKN